MNILNSITIVGAGTAGLTTALILKKKFPRLDIKIIKSDKIGIIGVGEGSTDHWKEFMDYCDIGWEEIIKETDATLKYGIMFEGWKEKRYFHNIRPELNNIKLGQYQAGYAHIMSNKIPNKDYTVKGVWYNTIDIKNLPNQFHFNTHKLNDFLTTKCLQRHITIINDEIQDVQLNNRGEILRLVTEKENYQSDFYIDCTGFKRLLISKLGAKWISFSKYLPMNEAIAFPTGDTDEYTPYTLSKAMTSGWMWRIPTYGRHGNGYVYNNNYITADKAKLECEKYLGHEVEIGKNIKFEAGTIDKAWIGNCVAIGLSSSFIEPLEATSIGTSLQQAFLLNHLIMNYDEKSIEKYNEVYNGTVENIRDFVMIHYLNRLHNSDFWKELEFEIPDSLQNKLDMWKNRIPMTMDFKNQRDYHLFGEYSFWLVLYELGCLDNNKVIAEYDQLNDIFKNRVTSIYNNLDRQNTTNGISHKTYLTNVRKA